MSAHPSGKEVRSDSNDACKSPESEGEHSLSVHDVSCEGCGTNVGVSSGPCPYAAELYDDTTPRNFCEECRYQRSQDI